MRSISPKLGRHPLASNATVATPAAMTQEKRRRARPGPLPKRWGRHRCRAGVRARDRSAGALDRPRRRQSGAQGVRRLLRSGRGRIQGPHPGRGDRWRRHQAAADRPLRAPQGRRHRSRRHVRQRSAGARRAAAVLSGLSGDEQARSGVRPRGDRRDRRGLPTGRLRADRRRDRRDARALPAGRLRSRRVRGRRGRAEPAPAAARHQARRRAPGSGIERRARQRLHPDPPGDAPARPVPRRSGALRARSDRGVGPARADPHLRAQPARSVGGRR